MDNLCNQNNLIVRPIPGTQELIPIIGLGTHLTFDVGMAPAPLRSLRAIVARFAELGGILVDTSPRYGTAESVVGNIAAETCVTSRLFWATKIWTTGKAAGIAQIEASQKFLQVDQLDLVQIHNLMEWQVHLTTLQELKSSGRIRYLGITHYHPGALSEIAAILRNYPIDFVQVPYNITIRDAEREVLPLAADLGVAVIINLPLGHGTLIRTVQGQPLPHLALELDCHNWAAFLLKFVIAHPAVTCVIPATSDLTHLEINLSAGNPPLPDEKQREQMAALVARF